MLSISDDRLKKKLIVSVFARLSPIIPSDAMLNSIITGIIAAPISVKYKEAVRLVFSTSERSDSIRLMIVKM